MLGEDEAVLRLPTVEEVDLEIVRRTRPASSGGQGIALLVVSMLLFVGAQQTFGGAPLTFIGLLAAVLVLHELGHLVAMRVFGFTDLRMFFIPFFGAAAAGRKPDATGTQRAIVALAGPLSGLVIAGLVMVVAVLVGFSPGPTMTEFLGLMLVLNFFNLLPLVPFDGGRFVNIVLFSRWPAVQLVFHVIAGAATIWLAVQMESWMFGLIGGFVLLGAGAAARLGRYGQMMRDMVPAPRPVTVLETAPEVRARMIAAMAPTMGLFRKHEVNVRRYAMMMNTGWGRALDAPPGAAASVVLSVVYLGFVGAGVALYLKFLASV